MPFLGLMTVASHKEILDEAKTEAFGEGVRHQQMVTPAYKDRQPEIDSLQGQLDAYKEHASEKDSAISGYKEVIEDLKPDAEKWRAQTTRERERQRKARAAAAAKKAAPKAAPAKRASKSRAKK